MISRDGAVVMRGPCKLFERAKQDYPMMKKEELSRRTFLKMLIGVMNALAGLALAIPGVSYVLTPVLRQSQEEWIEIGRERDFPGARMAKAAFRYIDAAGYVREERKGFAWLRRQDDGELIAFSPKCTHMGCNVAWVETNDRFECPCHGGMYDASGNVIAGPPPRPLDRFAVKIENERVFIQRLAG